MHQILLVCPQVLLSMASYGQVLVLTRGKVFHVSFLETHVCEHLVTISDAIIFAAATVSAALVGSVCKPPFSLTLALFGQASHGPALLPGYLAVQEALQLLLKSQQAKDGLNILTQCLQNFGGVPSGARLFHPQY